MSLRVMAGSFFGKVLGALFIAICLSLGFGPDKWADFVITGLPQWVTPEFARAVFVILGVSVLVLFGWPIVRSHRSDTETILARRAPPKVDSNQASRLSQIKKQLRNHILQADRMYEQILSEKVATQSLSEAERSGRLSVFAVPDCRRWHTDVKELIEKELGGSQANEFAWEYKQWDAYNWSTDLDFLLKFIGRKKNCLRNLANRITEADLDQ